MTEKFLPNISLFELDETRQSSRNQYFGELDMEESSYTGIDWKRNSKENKSTKKKVRQLSF